MRDGNETLKRCTRCNEPKTKRAFRYIQRQRAHADECRSCEKKHQTEKRCSTCCIVKPLAEFGGWGKGRKADACRPCVREKVRRSRGSVVQYSDDDHGPSLEDVRRAEAHDREVTEAAWHRLREAREAAGS